MTEPNDRRSVIIDCDPGHDDAVAILLAARHLDVLGITTVGGNQSLERVTENALRVLALGGLHEIPVAAGHARPLVNEPRHGGRIHGESGLDGATLPEPGRAIETRHAVEFIIDAVMSQDDLTLVPIGPLTNVASALLREPRLASRIREICLMGGSTGIGNITSAAEFNVGSDPEAAHVVFSSGVPLRMCGLNLTRLAVAGDDEIRAFRRLGNRTGVVVGDLISFYRDQARAVYGTAAVPIHDACAVVALVRPGLIRFRPMHVAIELRGEHTRGMTVCDDRFAAGFRPPWASAPNVEVGIDIDRSGFFQLLFETLRTYP